MDDLDPRYIQLLLSVAVALAPNGIVQEAIVQHLRLSQSLGASQREQVLMLTDVISDGLRHGNWTERV